MLRALKVSGPRHDAELIVRVSNVALSLSISIVFEFSLLDPSGQGICQNLGIYPYFPGKAISKSGIFVKLIDEGFAEPENC